MDPDERGAAAAAWHALRGEMRDFVHAAHARGWAPVPDGGRLAELLMLLGQASLAGDLWLRAPGGDAGGPAARLTVAVPRDDLERLTAAATSMTAMMRLAPEIGRGLVKRVAPDGTVEATISVDDELHALSHAVIRTRELLGWRAPSGGPAPGGTT